METSTGHVWSEAKSESLAASLRERDGRSHGWFTPDCAHFGWDMDFYFTPDCAHFRWDMVFQQTSCSTATSVTSAFFYNFVFEMAPKAALLGLHTSALPAPSTPEEAEVTADFRNFVEQHQFYVPNLNFAREEHPLRIQTRSLPAGIWMDLRYSSSHFEAICGLHPQDFVRLLRAADFLRVNFYGKEAARLLGRGREHLNWSHFAGMSYFSVDNVCYTHFKNVDDFLESLRQGRQVSKLPARNFGVQVDLRGAWTSGGS